MSSGRSEQVIMTLPDALYLGSHPALVGEKRPDPIDLVVTDEGVLFVRGRKTLGGIPWASVTDIFVDDREGIERRVTATRVLLLGALAFVARKETRVAYLVVSDADGDWMFGIPNMSSIELDASLAHLQRFVERRPLPPPWMPPSASNSSPGNRLQTLNELLQAGLITDEEFRQRRAAVIDGL